MVDTNAAVPWLSVIIPCYNEQKNLEHGVLPEVRTYLASRPYRWKVIMESDCLRCGVASPLS